MMRLRKSNPAIEEALTRTFVNERSELLWLAFLLTGDRDTSIDVLATAMDMDDVASPFFRNWMISWSRKLVIARALGSLEPQMAASVQRTRERRGPDTQIPGKAWSLDPTTGKAELEEALLAIDLFPRCALLLTVFERVSTDDAASLLNADRETVQTGKAIGLAELTRNLSRPQRRAVSAGFGMSKPYPCPCRAL